MAKTKRLPQQVVKVKNYGDAAINRLALADRAFTEMTDDERANALKWFKSKYSAQWPSDSY